jgi:hypothetical protein
MKKLLLFTFLAFLFNLNCYSQTKLPTIKSSKFSWEEKEQNKTFEVEFKYLVEDIIIPQERLNSVIMNAIIKCKYQLKNKLTFRPIELNIYKTDDNFTVFVKYVGKNTYGVESLSQSYFTFKNEDEINIELLFTK